ncbi:MAG: hypothetical protein MUQ00_04885 [Candidatus Aminicenantes bacterium]|nr:hypothetical protein [Candidatus Aminicenantes bacterium]
MSAGRPRPGSPARPNISKGKFVGAIVCALVGFFLVSCGKVSEEQRLIDRFKSMTDLAEAEDAAAIMEVFSDEYEDFEGRDKAATEGMIQNYFATYRGIVLHVLGVLVTDLQAEEASLEADVTFSSGAAQALRRLVRFAGEYYRIEIRWVKEGSVWMAAYAEWRQVGLDELFPESRDKLQKILPIN